MLETGAETEELERTANMFSAAGQYTQSVAIWMQLVSMMPDNWQFALSLATDLRRKGDHKESDEVYRRATRRFPTAFWILYNWALAAYEDQDLDHAEQRALRLVDICGVPMKEPLGLLGDIAVARRNFDEAERQFHRALQIDPDDSYLTARFKKTQCVARVARALQAREPKLEPADYGVLAINLDNRADRFRTLCDRFLDSPITIERVPGVYGSYLPDIALQQLCRAPSVTRRGTAGCFLAHAAAWEMSLRRGFDRCLILEDDAMPLFNLPGRFANLGIPADFDLCFVNHRMQPQYEVEAALQSYGFTCHDPVAVLASWPPNHGAPGGDGYFLSSAGARKLLQLVERDGFGGDVDWLLAGYSAAKGAASRMPHGSVAAAVFQHFEHFPEPRLRAFALYPALIDCDANDSDHHAQNVLR